MSSSVFTALVLGSSAIGVAVLGHSIGRAFAKALKVPHRHLETFKLVGNTIDHVQSVVNIYDKYGRLVYRFERSRHFLAKSCWVVYDTDRRIGMLTVNRGLASSWLELSDGSSVHVTRFRPRPAYLSRRLKFATRSHSLYWDSASHQLYSGSRRIGVARRGSRLGLDYEVQVRAPIDVTLVTSAFLSVLAFWHQSHLDQVRLLGQARRQERRVQTRRVQAQRALARFQARTRHWNYLTGSLSHW